MLNHIFQDKVTYSILLYPLKLPQFWNKKDGNILFVKIIWANICLQIMQSNISPLKHIAAISTSLQIYKGAVVLDQRDQSYF